MDFSGTVKWVVIGVTALILIVGLTWVTLALHNRATEISNLNDQLKVSNEHIKQTAETANENARVAKDLQKRLDDVQLALAAKTQHDTQLSGKIAGLQHEVKDAKPSTCVSPSILAVVAGLRNMQTGRGDGGQTAGSAHPSSGGPSYASASAGGTADPAQASTLIADWIADLYQHDATCTDNIAQIKQLEAVSP